MGERARSRGAAHALQRQLTTCNNNIVCGVFCAAVVCRMVPVAPGERGEGRRGEGAGAALARARASCAS